MMCAAAAAAAAAAAEMVVCVAYNTSMCYKIQNINRQRLAMYRWPMLRAWYLLIGEEEGTLISAILLFVLQPKFLTTSFIYFPRFLNIMCVAC